METEKEIEYKSTIMEMRNIIKNQERVIEQLMFDMLNIKIDIEEVDEVAWVAWVAWVDRNELNYFYKIFLPKHDHLRKRFLLVSGCEKLRWGS